MSASVATRPFLSAEHALQSGSGGLCRYGRGRSASGLPHQHLLASLPGGMMRLFCRSDWKPDDLSVLILQLVPGQLDFFALTFFPLH